MNQPTVTPHLVCRNATAAIEFYKKAFGFKEAMRLQMPNSTRIMHAHLTLGDSAIMMAEEFPDMPGSTSPQALNGTPVVLHINTPDVDALFKQAIAAGATEKMPPADMFWGDRYAQVQDPFGHMWSMGARRQNLTAEQIGKNAAAAMCAQ